MKERAARGAAGGPNAEREGGSRCRRPFRRRGPRVARGGDPPDAAPGGAQPEGLRVGEGREGRAHGGGDRKIRRARLPQPLRRHPRPARHGLPDARLARAGRPGGGRGHLPRGPLAHQARERRGPDHPSSARQQGMRPRVPVAFHEVDGGEGRGPRRRHLRPFPGRRADLGRGARRGGAVPRPRPRQGRRGEGGVRAGGRDTGARDRARRGDARLLTRNLVEEKKLFEGGIRRGTRSG